MFHYPDGLTPIPCLKADEGRCHVCEVIDPGNPRFSPGYAKLFGVLADCGPTPDPEPDVGPQRPDPAEMLAIIARMKACPNWIKSTDCGCGNNRCAAGKGKDGIVSHNDCFDCLKENN